MQREDPMCWPVMVMKMQASPPGSWPLGQQQAAAHAYTRLHLAVSAVPSGAKEQAGRQKGLGVPKVRGVQGLLLHSAQDPGNPTFFHGPLSTCKIPAGDSGDQADPQRSLPSPGERSAMSYIIDPRAEESRQGRHKGSLAISTVFNGCSRLGNCCPV